MKHIICILFLATTQLAFGQLNLPAAGFRIYIAKVAPTQVKSIRFNDSLNTFETVMEDRQFSIIEGGSLDTSMVENKKLLNFTDQVALIDILEREEEDRVSKLADCYIPRHIILFNNESGTLIGAIELCFQCWRNKPYKVYEHFKYPLEERQYEDLELIFEKYELLD